MSLTNFYSMTKRTRSRCQKTPKSCRKRSAVHGLRSPVHPQSQGDMLGSQVMTLSQSESEPEVRWDNNSPSPRRIMQLTRQGLNGAGADLSDIVKRLATADDEISPSPPMLGLWMDKTGPNCANRKVSSPVKPPVRTSRRKRVGGLSAEAEQELQRLAAELNIPAKSRNENGNNGEPVKSSGPAVQSAPTSQRISQYSSEGGDVPESFTLFDEPTQNTDASSQRSEAKLSQNASQGAAVDNETDRGDTNVEDSLDALWEDDDLFNNDSFVRIATQLPADFEPDFRSPPRSSKRKSVATSTPLPTKHARYETATKTTHTATTRQESRATGRCLLQAESNISHQSPAQRKEVAALRKNVCSRSKVQEATVVKDTALKRNVSDGAQSGGKMVPGNRFSMVTRSSADRYRNGQTPQLVQNNNNKPYMNSSGKYNFKPPQMPSSKGTNVGSGAQFGTNNSNLPSRMSTTSGTSNSAQGQSMKSNAGRSAYSQAVKVPTTAAVQSVVCRDSELCDTSIPDDILLSLAEPDDFFDMSGPSSSSSTLPTQILPSPKTAPTSHTSDLQINTRSAKNMTASCASSVTQNKYSFTKLRPGVSTQTTCVSSTATITSRNNDRSRNTATTTAAATCSGTSYPSRSKKAVSMPAIATMGMPTATTVASARSSTCNLSNMQSNPYRQCRGFLRGKTGTQEETATKDCWQDPGDRGGQREEFTSGDDDDLLLQAVLSQEILQGKEAKQAPAVQPAVEDPPTQCSPEEIERKKLQALERRKKKLQLGTQIQAPHPPKGNSASSRLQRSKSCNVLTSRGASGLGTSSNGRRLENNVPPVTQRNAKR